MWPSTKKRELLQQTRCSELLSAGFATRRFNAAGNCARVITEDYVVLSAQQANMLDASARAVALAAPLVTAVAALPLPVLAMPIGLVRLAG